MNLENMKCFISLAECLNFTKAADKEHITQTSMSRKISSLEDELNVRLFYRDNHSVVLTDAGREFYIQAQRLLEAYNASIETVQNIHQGFTRSLKIGVGIYESELLSPFLGTYVSDHPDLRITCLQYSYRELLKRFEQNLLDVIITSDQFLAGIQKEYFNAAMIYEHDWRLAICRESPLASLEKISSSDLENEVLITMYDGSISQISDHYKPFFRFRDIIHVNSYDTKMMMVNAGLGFGMIPDFIRLGKYDHVIKKSFAFPYLPRKFYALCRKNDPNFYVNEFFGEYVEFTAEGNGAAS